MVLTAVALQQLPGPEGPGLLDFFWQSGPMAKFVLGVLIAFSLASWAIMIAKFLHFRRADGQSDRFLEAFHRSARFSEVNAVAAKLGSSPLVGIFQAGYAEIDGQIKHAHDMEPAPPTGVGKAAGERRYRISSLAALERSLARAVGVELAGVARWTPFLATTAAATPFIGLFGTVWGIMVAFQDIGTTGSTSLVAVAPGIADALINTAAGLAAAIPALVGYNYFAARIRGLRARMEDFVQEFINMAERNFT